MSIPKSPKVQKDAEKQPLPNRAADRSEADRNTEEPGGLYTDVENTGTSQRPTPGTEKDETPPNRADKIG